VRDGPASLQVTANAPTALRWACHPAIPGVPGPPAMQAATHLLEARKPGNRGAPDGRYTEIGSPSTAIGIPGRAAPARS